MGDLIHDNYNQPLTSRWVSAYLLSAQILTGTGNALDTRPILAAMGTGFYAFTTLGQSASAQFLVSLDSAIWFGLTSVNAGVNVTATGVISGKYPFWCAQLTWNSGGAASATAHLALSMG